VAWLGSGAAGGWARKKKREGGGPPSHPRGGQALSRFRFALNWGVLRGFFRKTYSGPSLAPQDGGPSERKRRARRPKARSRKRRHRRKTPDRRRRRIPRHTRRRERPPEARDAPWREASVLERRVARDCEEHATRASAAGEGHEPRRKAGGREAGRPKGAAGDRPAGEGARPPKGRGQTGFGAKRRPRRTATHQRPCDRSDDYADDLAQHQKPCTHQTERLHATEAMTMPMTSRNTRNLAHIRPSAF